MYHLHQGGFPNIVAGIYIRASFQQKTQDNQLLFALPSLRCLHESRSVRVVSGVDIGSVIQQKTNCILISIADRFMQKRTLVPTERRIDIGSPLDQGYGDRKVFVRRSREHSDDRWHSNS